METKKELREITNDKLSEDELEKFTYLVFYQYDETFPEDEYYY